MNWLVYIVECCDGTYYTGSTNDLDKRIAKHNAGKGSKYTRSRLPVTLRWYEGGFNKSAALSKEAHIKKLTRKKKEELITKNEYE